MKTSRVIIVGCGRVGRELIRQIRDRAPLLRRRGLDLRVVGLVERRSVALAPAGLEQQELSAVADSQDGPEALAFSRPHPGADVLWRQTGALSAPAGILVDVTAEPAASLHLDWLRAGWSVVTANKKALSDSMGSFDAIMAVADHIAGPRYFFETTVGAGLPVIGTLQSLLATGDEVVEIACAVSGTLGSVFAACDRGLVYFSR